jgi:hemerythrin-like domain-containing protein
MDAMKLLEEDHRKVKKLLEEGDKTTEQATKRRTELLNELLMELRIHETIEEEIFYPALEEHAKTKEIALEGYEEHHAVDNIAEELVVLDPSDETWAAKFTVMKENIEHHIEEEEGEMFGQARSVFSADELESLGARMLELKKLGQQVGAAD